MANKDIYVNDEGALVVPPELAERFGLKPGARIAFETDADEILLRRPASQLARVYIEPTNECNLCCSHCIRHTWDAPAGRMSAKTYDRILEGLSGCTPRPSLFFGGFGEPLSHPDIVEMIRKAKATGSRVELITNGTLLSLERIDALIDLQLDILWVSIDGASPETHADVRLGSELPRILKSLDTLYRSRLLRFSRYPKLGISFVATKRNIGDLPAIVSIGIEHDARKLSISNLLPYTRELKDQILYERSGCGWRGGFFDLQFPRLDISDAVQAALGKLVLWFGWNALSGQERERRRDLCPFVARGSMSIRWDGSASPCLPLLYAHESFLGDRLRRHSAFAVGSVLDRSVMEIWNDPAYLAIRERLAEFDFSPCTECNSCELADENREDCFGNALPACGGCLWAQGFIRCP